MKVVLLITALVSWLYTPAQDTRLHSPLAPGKGRLVVLFTVQSDNFSRPQTAGSDKRQVSSFFQ